MRHLVTLVPVLPAFVVALEAAVACVAYFARVAELLVRIVVTVDDAVTPFFFFLLINKQKYIYE